MMSAVESSVAYADAAALLSVSVSTCWALTVIAITDKVLESLLCSAGQRREYIGV
jgi:hypothetical protein